jgi:hypothetical protein
MYILNLERSDKSQNARKSKSLRKVFQKLLGGSTEIVLIHSKRKRKCFDFFDKQKVKI